MHFISKVFLILGLLSMSFSFLLIWERVNPNRLSFNSYETSVSTSQINTPVRIIIKDANINLPIIPAQISKGKWETTKSGVSYLASSPVPGTKGNSILYGHNWLNLLGNLNRVSPGQEIEIVYQNRSRKKFIINTIGTVTPDQTHVLSPSLDTRITLYTCTGFMDSKRLVVTATFVENDTTNTHLTDNINTL